MSSANAETSGPMAVMQMLQGAQATGILNAGIELNVFQKLAEAPLDARAASERIGCPERSTRILLDALTVLGLLAKEGTKYRLTPTASEHLVPGKPMYMGDVRGIFASDVFWTALPRLAEAVKKGGTILDKHAETPANPFWESFAQSSASMAFPGSMAIDAVVGAWIDSKPKCRVLDIAAGSGIYGFTLAKHANVELTSLDWPNVLEKTREWAGRLGVDAKRVKYLPGNLFEVDYGGPYDLILLSHVYHHFETPKCAALTKKVASALARGGRVAVQDMVYDSALENPGAAMFSMVMLMWTQKGESFTLADYTKWFADAGLSAPEAHASQGMPSTWLVGEKR
jgi:2-polyprenyl-3-methyl-5-hydroxy-6-metoxy-1,4-benzoquinol methylase